jgi:hypothetical protein
MTPNQLADAARNLAHGLGIPVYIRDGRLYQHGPSLAFLRPSDTHPTVTFPPRGGGFGMTISLMFIARFMRR